VQSRNCCSVDTSWDRYEGGEVRCAVDLDRREVKGVLTLCETGSR
jgi:hypothetical protein